MTAGTTLDAVITALSFAELGLTIAKSALLSFTARPAPVVLAFVAETLCGLCVSALLAAAVAGIADRDAGFVAAALALLLLAELYCVGVEATHIRARLRPRPRDPAAAPRRRAALHAVAAGLAAAQLGLAWFHALRCDPGVACLAFLDNTRYPSTFRVPAAVVFAVLALLSLQLVLLVLVRPCVRARCVARVLVALGLLALDLGIAFAVLVAGSPFGGDVSDDFSFSDFETLAVLFFAVGSFVASLSAFRLVGYKESGYVTDAQATYCEIVALALPGPALALSFSGHNRTDVVVVLAVILPQSAVILFPLLFEYAKGLFGKRRNAGPKSPARSKLAGTAEPPLRTFAVPPSVAYAVQPPAPLTVPPALAPAVPPAVRAAPCV